VYEVTAEPSERRLTESAVTAPEFVDKRIEWGGERCYTVRAVHTRGALSVESEPAMPACATLADTFPPAAPTGLIAVASEGAINLIWNANTEKDLAGYLLLRAPAETRAFAPAIADPIRDTTFTDKVQPGIPYVYAVVAVDTAGNRSAPSAESTPEPAR
jgi:predicted phage tail protein